MQKCKLKNSVFIILGFLFLSACTTKTIEVSTTTIPPGNISFSTQVVPIFTKSCAFTGCHAAGGVNPNLSPTAAYSSLTTLHLLDTVAPAQSVLYMKITSGTMSQYIQSASDVQIILKWIQQGAKNN